MVEQLQESKVPDVNVQRMDSTDDPLELQKYKVMDARPPSPRNPDGSIKETFATNDERLKALHDFNVEQNQILIHHHEEDAKHDHDRERVLHLEAEVDLKIELAIRRAQQTISQSEAEYQNVEQMLGDEAVLLEKIRIEREGFSKDE